MERKKFIRVPINKNAVKNYELGILREDELQTLVLSDDQYRELCSTGVFEMINNKCNISIAERKDEILMLNEVPAAIGIVTKLISENDNADLPDIKKMLEFAVSFNTIVGFDF